MVEHQGEKIYCSSTCLKVSRKIYLIKGSRGIGLVATLSQCLREFEKPTDCHVLVFFFFFFLTHSIRKNKLILTSYLAC